MGKIEADPGVEALIKRVCSMNPDQAKVFLVQERDYKPVDCTAENARMMIDSGLLEPSEELAFTKLLELKPVTRTERKSNKHDERRWMQ